MRARQRDRAVAGDDLAGDPGGHVAGGQQRERAVGVVRRATTATMPTPMLKVRSISACSTLPRVLHQVEDRLRPPGGAVERGRQVLGQHAGQVGRRARRR